MSGTKRGVRGQGTVYWDESRHRFVAEQTVGYDARGKRVKRRGYGDSKSAALRAVRDKVKAYQAGLAAGADRYTVADAVRDWLEHGQGRVVEATVNKHRDLARHAVEGLGGIRLRDLRAADVDRWLKGLAGSHATSTLRQIRWCLKKSVQHAMIREMVSRNVVDLVDVPRGTGGRPSKSLTLEQARAVVTDTKDHPMHAYVVVSMLVGLRTEEVRALRWDRVRLDADVPHVEVWRSARAGGDTKTLRSRRTLALPRLVVDVLREQRDRQPSGRSLVFGTSRDTVRDAANVRRDFRAALDRVRGMEPWADDGGTTHRPADAWTPRELRHSFVSLMSEANVPLEEISRLVGHSGTQVTELVYRHELRPVLAVGATAMDQVFAGA